VADHTTEEIGRYAGMRRADLRGRPTGVTFVVCGIGAMTSVLLVVAAVVLLVVGHAGVTLVLLPTALVCASVATYLLESSRPPVVLRDAA
jgi:nucleotide-binding universal stress UspA family protein